MAVRVVDLGALSTRSQLALIQRTSLLVGAHGAGLLWNLFLPEGAALVELLNLANANQYYANHCRWARRRYGKWQNTDAAREERALDPLTREPVDPFRNHMRVMVDEVVRVAVGVLNQRRL
jgi:capsular polysaccharide biosynthesis protein